jgi:hypothetical protein
MQHTARALVLRETSNYDSVRKGFRLPELGIFLGHVKDTKALNLISRDSSIRHAAHDTNHDLQYVA